jgi:hypothetical protein
MRHTKHNNVLWQVQIPKAGIEYHLFVSAPPEAEDALAQVLCELETIKDFFSKGDFPSLTDAIAPADGNSICDSSRKVYARKTKITMP